MNNRPTLLILAAGMGSRYGSLKQMDGVGPSGETIMDYSIFDAIRAGFGKIVFVIRKDFESDFRQVFSAKRFKDQVKVEYCLQELDMLPPGFVVNPNRTKPWGTNHAILVAKNVIHEPFAVINADDFYGRHSFEVLGKFLEERSGTENQYCMVGYQLDKTLSEQGAVSRGVCSVDQAQLLTGVVERTQIERDGEGIAYKDSEGKRVPLDAKSIVSMNMWGFTPGYFGYTEGLFSDFLRENAEEPKAEFFIPKVVNHLVAEKIATLKVLRTDAEWFGVTYQGDRPGVVAKLKSLASGGEYPQNLWA